MTRFGRIVAATFAFMILVPTTGLARPVDWSLVLGPATLHHAQFNFGVPSPPGFPPIGGGGGGPLGGCSLPKIPSPDEIATSVNNALKSQLKIIKDSIDEANKKADAVRSGIKADIIDALKAPFTGLGTQLGKVVGDKIAEVSESLWDQLYPLLTKALVVLTVVLCVFIGFPLKAFIDWLLLGRRKRA